MSEPAKRYKVTASMSGVRANLVVSDGPDPYSTTDLADAERIKGIADGLAPAYLAARIEPA